MATNSRQQVKTGTQKAKPKNPIFDNLVTQKVSPTGPSASGNSTNHLISTEPTCRSEAAFMFMFPQLSSLPSLVRSFNYARILREQTSLQKSAGELQQQAASNAENNLRTGKESSVSAEKDAAGESVAASKASVARQHRVLMDAFNVDFSYEDNGMDPSDSMAIVFNMDDLTQACPAGTGKTNVNYLGKIVKPFVMPVAYVEDLHQQDLFGALAPKLTPSSVAAGEDKQAFSTLVTWKAFSFHNQFRRTQGGLNPLYSVIGSRYVTDWAAAFSPALKARGTKVLEGDAGKITFDGNNYSKLLKARGLFTLSEYPDAQVGNFSTGMYYKPGIWGTDLGTSVVVGSIDKKVIRTREFMNLLLKTKKAKKEIEIAKKQSSDSTKAQRTSADVLRLGFQWQDYIDALSQTSKAASGGASSTAFDIIRTKFLPTIIKAVKDADGSYIVSTVSEDAALEVAKSIKVYGYENPPLYELGIPKPKEMSLSKFEDYMKGFGIAFHMDKSYTFLGSIMTNHRSLPLPTAFKGFNFSKLWSNRDPQDPNYFDILQEDLLVSDLEIYTKVNNLLERFASQTGGVIKFREAAFKNTPFLKNGTIAAEEMVEYIRNDAKPPVPKVTREEMENYLPHTFSTVDSGKILMGKRTTAGNNGTFTLEDVEVKAYSMLGSSGFLLDRMPGEVMLTSNPSLIVGKPLPKEGAIEPEDFVLSNAVYPGAPTSEQAKRESEEAKKIQADRQMIGEMAGFIQGKVAAPMRFDSIALGFNQGTTQGEPGEDGSVITTPIPITTQKNGDLTSILDGVLRIMFNPSAMGTKIVAPLVAGALANRTPGSKMFEFYIEGGEGDESILVAEIGNRVSFDFVTRTGPLANEFPTDLLQFIRQSEYNTSAGKYNRTFLTFALRGEPEIPDRPGSATYFIPGRETCYVDMHNLVSSGSIAELFAERLVAIYLKTPKNRLAPSGLQIHGYLVENLMAYYFWLCCLFLLKQYGVYPPGNLGNNIKYQIGDKGYIPLDDMYTMVNVTSSQNGNLEEVPVYPMFLDSMAKTKMNASVPKPMTTEFTLPENFKTQVGMLQAGFLAKGALLNLGYRSVLPDIAKLVNLKGVKRMALGGTFDPEEKNILSYDAQTNSENPLLAKNLVNAQTEAERIAGKITNPDGIGTYHTEEPADLVSTETARNIDISGPAIFDISIEDVAVRPVVSSLLSIKATSTVTVPFAPKSIVQTIGFRGYSPRSFMTLHTINDYAFNKKQPLIKGKNDVAEISLEALLLPNILIKGRDLNAGGANLADLGPVIKSAEKAVNVVISKSAQQIIADPLNDTEVATLRRANSTDLTAITSLLGSKMTNVATLMSGPLTFNSRLSAHDIAGNPSYPLNTTLNGTKFDGGMAFGFREQSEAAFFPIDFATSIGSLMSQSSIARGQRKALIQGFTHLYQLMKKGKKIKEAYPNAKNPLAGMYVGSAPPITEPNNKSGKGKKDVKNDFYVLVIPDIPISGLPSKEDMMKGATIATSSWRTNANASLDSKVFSTPASYGIASLGNVVGTYDVADSSLIPQPDGETIIDPREKSEANPDFHPPLLAMDTYGYLQHYISQSKDSNAVRNLRHDYNKRYTAKNMDAWANLIDDILVSVKSLLDSYKDDQDLKHKAVRFYATNMQFLKREGQTDDVPFLIPIEKVKEYILAVPREKLVSAGGAFESLDKNIGTTKALVDAILATIEGAINIPTSFGIWATDNEKQNLKVWLQNALLSSIAFGATEIQFSPSAYYLVKIFAMSADVWRKTSGRAGAKVKQDKGLKLYDVMSKLLNILEVSESSAKWKQSINLLKIIDPLLINGGLAIRNKTQKKALGNNTSQLDFVGGKLSLELGVATYFTPGLTDSQDKKRKTGIAGIGDFNNVVGNDISKVSVSYGTQFVKDGGGKFPVSMFISKNPDGNHRKVITHTGLIFENPSNPALAPFTMAGLVSGEEDSTGKTILNGVQIPNQFNILDRTDDNPLLSGIGFEVGEACRQYLTLKWWIKQGNVPESLRTLITARTKNLFVMDFARASAEMAAYLKSPEIPKTVSLANLINASYSESLEQTSELSQALRLSGSTFETAESNSLSRAFLPVTGVERRPYMPSTGALGIPLATPRGDNTVIRDANNLGINVERTYPANRYLLAKNATTASYEDPKNAKSLYKSSSLKVGYKVGNDITESVDADLLWLMYSLFSARLFVGTDALSFKILTPPATIDIIDGPKPPNSNPSFDTLDKIGELIDSGERADVLDNVVKF